MVLGDIPLKTVNPSIKHYFHKELKFMSRLHHKNIVQVLGACLTGAVHSIGVGHKWRSRKSP